MLDIIKGIASCWPIQKELNDNPYILLGGKVLYRESDLESVLESCYHQAYKR